MKLLIDTTNGIAGDIVSAGLIGLGAPEKRVLSALEYAGNLIGRSHITVRSDQGIMRLDTVVHTDGDHLRESMATEFLDDIARTLHVPRFFRGIAEQSLNILCRAERYVHSRDKRLQHMLSSPQSTKEGRHSQHTSVSSQASGVEALLHEAQDILIDITGVMVGMQDLQITEVYYLDYINVGGGTITFSHGTFPVPAPATHYILNKYGFRWKRTDHQGEMTTPTGASLLAGCNAQRIDTLNEQKIVRKSFAQGTRPFPPVVFYLTD